jgi:DNA-binding MurR/RpiR family transcriptional regulator
LEEWPQERHAIIKYGTLVQNSEQTVLNLYERFGFNMHPRFRQVLQEEAEKARQYKSQHVYSLEQTGLTREKVVSDYKDIFERFGFDTMEGDATRNF